MASDLLDLIRQKQDRITQLEAELKGLRAELEEAGSVLVSGRRVPPATGAGSEVMGGDHPIDVGPSPGKAEALIQRLVEGSSVTLALRVLQREGHSMHVGDIVTAIEQQFHRRVLQDTLVGNISRMIKANKNVFVKTAPNTFGLAEWQEGKIAQRRMA